jgi:unsaturated chondroitin disaccharide hydrolase
MDETTHDYAGLAIIDGLMNLPLLFWAARESGKGNYYETAIAHANTTLAHFVRTDGSVYHAFRFDPTNGSPMRPDNYCGYAVDSHWARGAAWAIYGFALAYRHTRDSRYLDASERLATRFVAQLDAELVPLWDFRLPAGAVKLRDSSAAAIVVCGLDQLVAHKPSEEFVDTADALLRRLCSDAYLDANLDCPGVLRGAEVGDGVGEQPGTMKARSAYASWGDYFFMEALSRRLHGAAGWW